MLFLYKTPPAGSAHPLYFIPKDYNTNPELASLRAILPIKYKPIYLGTYKLLNQTALGLYLSDRFSGYGINLSLNFNSVLKFLCIKPTNGAFLTRGLCLAETEMFASVFMFRCLCLGSRWRMPTPIQKSTVPGYHQVLWTWA